MKIKFLFFLLCIALMQLPGDLLATTNSIYDTSSILPVIEGNLSFLLTVVVYAGAGGAAVWAILQALWGHKEKLYSWFFVSLCIVVIPKFLDVIYKVEGMLLP